MARSILTHSYSQVSRYGGSNSILDHTEYCMIFDNFACYTCADQRYTVNRYTMNGLIQSIRLLELYNYQRMN